MEKIGAFWKSKTKKGEFCLSGNINGQKVLILKNNRKNQDKQPDFVVFLIEKKTENNIENVKKIFNGEEWEGF